MRAAIYARYSTDMQSAASIEDQIRVCRERVEQERWTYCASYSDRAASGASRLRRNYQALLEDARRGAFDIVVAEALDRLSRDQEDVAHLFKHLSFAGIKLFTLSEGEISEIHIGLSGTMGALYVKQLAEKTRRGLRGRVEQGRSGGGRSFGYDIVSTGHADERGQAGELRINSAEAEIVRRIFKLYCDGVSPREIAKTLNREQVPGPWGGPWGPSTINGNVQRCTGILNNELYLGRMLWNRLRYVKDPSTGKRRSKPNPRTAWVIGQVPHLRIVSQDLWEAAKTRQQAVTRETRPSRGRQEFWKHQRPRYLLSGLMKCGVCGASYTKHGQSRFACAAFHDRGTCDNRLTIRGDEVEAAILDGLKSRLMSADLFEEFAREFTAEINRQRMTEAASLDATRRELDRLDLQITRLVDAVANGADAKALNDRIKELEGARPGLEARLANAGFDQPLLHPSLAKVYRDKVERLTEAMRDPVQGREVFEIIRGLIAQVRLVPNGGELSIELLGDLAGILAVTERAKDGGATPGEKALQIKMVAGARNHLYRTLIQLRKGPERMSAQP